MKFDYIWQRSIYLLFAVLFFAVPFLFTSVNFELFEFNKMLLVYLSTALLSGAWLGRIIIQRRFIHQKTPLDLFFYLFIGFQILSSVFSIDRHTSFWGYYSRFNGGLLSLICYFLLFKALASNLDRNQVKRLIWVSLGAGLIISIYGILEHFGHSFSCLMFTGNFNDVCWIQDVQNRVFATIGQPNWLAAYLTVLIPITWGLVLNSKCKRQNAKLWMNVILYSLFIFYYLCLLFTKSRSGYLGFIVSFFIFWPVTFYIFKKQVIRPFLLITFLILFFTFIYGSPISQLDRYLSLNSLKSHFNSANQPANQLPDQPSSQIPVGPQLEIGGTESGEIRKIVWQGAIDAFKHHPILGTGPETFAYSYYQYRPLAHNLVSEWDFLYNKAHNEYLNYLATTGGLGLISYLLLIGTFFVLGIKYINNQKSKCKITDKKEELLNIKPEVDIGTLPFALIAAEAAILVSNFFGFSVVITNLYLFLIPGFVFILTSAPTDQSLISNQPNTKSAKKYLLVIPAVISLYCTVYIVRLWQADYFYNQGDKNAKQDLYLPAYENFNKAVMLSPSEPVFQSDLAYAAANLVVLAASQNDPTTSAQLQNIALVYSDKAYSTSPYNMNLLKTRVKVFYALSLIDRQYDQMVIDTLKDAINKAPTDPKLVYNLGLVYGKQGNVEKALELVEKSVQMKLNYADGRNALALYYEDLQQYDKALEQLEYINKYINPDDQTIKDRIGQLKNKLPVQ